MKKDFDPYRELGIERTASDDEIVLAGKRHAKRTHPDVKGGSEEAFADGRLALAILTNKTRRAKFDNTGAFDETKPDNTLASARMQIETEIGELINKYLMSGFKPESDPRQMKVIAAIDINLVAKMEGYRQTIRDGKLHLAFIEDMAKRFTRKNPEDDFDFVARRFENQIEDVKTKIGELETALAGIKKAREILSTYKFKSMSDEWPTSPALGIGITWAQT